MYFRHIIFDCDGVLIDREPLSMRVDQELLAANGVVLSQEEVARRFIGFTFAALIAQVREEFGVELPGDISAEKDRRLIALYLRELAAVEGTIDAVKSLRLPKSIASNSPRHRVEIALRVTGLDRFFDGHITTFEDVSAAKPAPDIYFLAAERAGLVPAQCIVIEDSWAGVTAAAAAGCRVIGFSGLAEDRELAAKMLTEAGAAQVIASLHDLAEAIRSEESSRPQALARQ
jgi:HAD superfamily hydrolase (TIGR01509 family)